MSEFNNTIINASAAFNVKFKGGQEAAEPDYKGICTVIPSVAATTGYGFLGEFPMLKEWIGERDVKNLADHDYSVKNKLYEASISVKRTDFEDNDYGKYGPLFEEMGRQGEEYPDEVVFSLLKNGLTDLCYDGQPFFSVEHPARNGVASNLFDVAAGEPEGERWYLLDTRRALKPMIWQERVKPAIESVVANGSVIDSHVFLQDQFFFGVRARGNAGFTLWQLAASSNKALSADSFNQLYDAMFAAKTDSGRPLRVRPSLLVVPPSLRQAAMQITQREYLQNGESNPLYKIVDVLVSPWL